MKAGGGTVLTEKVMLSDTILVRTLKDAMNWHILAFYRFAGMHKG
jgi:hypothetical protein